MRGKARNGAPIMTESYRPKDKARVTKAEMGGYQRGKPAFKGTVVFSDNCHNCSALNTFTMVFLSNKPDIKRYVETAWLCGKCNKNNKSTALINFT